MPKDIHKDEVENPDVQRNLFSLYYCTQRYKQCDAEVKKLQSQKVRIPKPLQEDWLMVKSISFALILNLVPKAKACFRSSNSQRANNAGPVHRIPEQKFGP